MSRWEPNGKERMQAAAMELFAERGYDETTSAAIAERAGLTERTFFRYFADKREVLFSGSKELEKLVVDGIAAAPKSTAPLAAVIGAFVAAGPFFDARRGHAKKRLALIEAHADLQERELIKMATLGAVAAESLRRRGVNKQTAALVAETGITVFKNAFSRWVEDTKKKDLAHHMHAVLAELQAVSKVAAAR